MNSSTDMHKDMKKLGRIWPGEREGMKHYLQYVKIIGFFPQKKVLHWCLPKHSATTWHQAESLLINMCRITFLAHFFKITGCIVAVFQILLPLEPDSLSNAFSK